MRIVSDFFCIESQTETKCGRLLAAFLGTPVLFEFSVEVATETKKKQIITYVAKCCSVCAIFNIMLYGFRLNGSVYIS